MMSRTDNFVKSITDGNTFKGDFITLGSAMLDGQTITNTFVKIPLKTKTMSNIIFQKNKRTQRETPKMMPSKATALR